MSGPGRRLAWAVGLAVVWLVGVGVAPTATHAASPTVVVEPAGPLGDQEATITVRGSGFDPDANGGVGVYVVFGQRTAAPSYHDDALLYDAARWVHRGATDTPGQAALSQDGTFETTLDIAPRYTDGHDRLVDCLVVECAVITMSAHGVKDRSLDTFTPISFAAAETVMTAATEQESARTPLVIGAVVIGLLAVLVFGLVARMGSARIKGQAK